MSPGIMKYVGDEEDFVLGISYKDWGFFVKWYGENIFIVYQLLEHFPYLFSFQEALLDLMVGYLKNLFSVYLVLRG